jgi:NADH:ubiquinone oxidoreductase subunit 5 (subunit L)/multisubunit Na+/H+ antiporter MnhA subunit
MLLGTGITALYTVRMVWFVCFGPPPAGKVVHATPLAMRLALAPLALAALTTWLVAGRFASWLASTLPNHHLDLLSTTELVTHVLFNVATAATLALVTLALALWWSRDRLAWATKRLGRLQVAAAQGFGFEWLNRRLAQMVQDTAGALQMTQTGQLNWNVAGMVIGLVVILAVLAGGQ